MGLIDIGAVLVAIVAALGAWAAQRSAGKAGTIQTAIKGRMEAEHGAYERAREFDTETIRRQDEEIRELRKELEIVKELLYRLKKQYPDWRQVIDAHISFDDPE